MHARIIVAGQHFYYDNVVKAWTTPFPYRAAYLHLRLSSHPTLVHFWLSPTSKTSVLLAADGEAFTAALREEVGAQ